VRAAGEVQSDVVQRDAPGQGIASTSSLFAKFSTRVLRGPVLAAFIPEMDGLGFVAIAMVVLYHLNG